MIGPNGVINVSSFLASTMDISNEDFMAGNYNFKQDMNKPLSSIINQGTITAEDRGFVALAAPYVSNEGKIVANLGKVYMASGEEFVLNLTPDGLIGFAVDGAVKDEIIGSDGEVLESNVKNTGKITADGGEVILSAKTAYDVVKSVVNNEGIIEAKTIINKNGVIILDGGESGIVSNSGTLDASGKEEDQTGGTVEVLGEYVGLFDGSRIDISGHRGGGHALIGGDFQGKNPDIQNAYRTFVGKDTTINADAISSGDGGRVIIWADDITRYYGDISARGGSLSGNGGFVETSGKKYLDFAGLVNVGASNGRGGTWLLDPEDINITTAQANITQSGSGDPGPIAFSPTANDTVTTIDVTNINTALNNGSNVTINTASGGTTTSGTITVNSAISKTADGGNADGSTLTLTADDDIIVNNTISSNSGVLNVVLNAANDVDINAAITTNGGTFTSSGTTFDNTGGIITSGNGAISITADAITIGAAIGAGAGNITLKPSTGGRDILLGSDSCNNCNPTGLEAINVAGNALALNNTELQNLASSGTVIIGDSSAGGSANILLGNDENLDLSLENYNLTLNADMSSGGDIYFADLDANPVLTLNSDKTLTFNSYSVWGWGQALPDVDVYIRGGSNTGTIIVNTTSNFTGQSYINLDVDRVQGSSGGNIRIEALGNLLISDNLSAAAGKFAIYSTGALDIAANKTVSATGAGTDIDLRVNTDGTGNENFTMGTGSSITSEDTSTSAISITVNSSSSGGTGTATIETLSATGEGGDITVTTVGTGGGGGITVNGAISTAAVTTNGTASGDITLTTGTGGGVIINGTLTTGSSTVAEAAGAETATSGSITVTAGAGQGITGNASGRLITGNAQVDGTTGNDTATSGSITIDAGAAVQLLGTNALTIGNATATSGDAGDSAITGNITIGGTTSPTKISSDGGTGQVDVSFGTASAGGGTATAGTLAVTTSGGAGDAGGIFITSAENLSLGVLDTADLTGQSIIIDTTGGANLTVTDVVEDIDGDTVVLDANTGTLTISDSSFNIAAGGLTLRGDEIDLTGGANSIQGTGGTITIEAGQAATTVGINNAASTLDLSTTDIAAIQNGFASITIGRTDGTGAVTIGAGGITFNDPVTIRATGAGGTITTNGQITGSGNASVTIDGPGATTTLNADIVTAGNAITISDNVLIDDDSGTGILLDTTNGDTTAAANVYIAGTIDSVASENNSLTIDAEYSAGSDADVTIDGAIGTSQALSTLTINGNDISLPSIGSGSAGVTGATAVTGVTDGVDTGSITFTGTTYNANQQTYTAPAGQTFLMNAGVPTTFTSSDDTITFSTGDILLADGSDLTVNSNGTWNSGTATITFQNIRGNSHENVSLTAGGRLNWIYVGAIGNGDEIRSVSLDSWGTVVSGDIYTSNTAGNDFNWTCTWCYLDGDRRIDTNTAGNDGNITISGMVEVWGATSNFTFDAGNGNINVGSIGNNGTVDSFTVSSASTIDTGYINTKDGVDITANTINLSGNVRSDGDADAGAITLTGNVTLKNNITIDSDAATTDGNVTINGSINADDASANNRTLTIESGSGTVTFGGAVGTTQALADLDVTAATINLNGSTLQIDDQGGNTATFTGAVVLGNNVAIDTDGATDNNITVTGTVAPDAAAFNRTFTFTAGTGDILITDSVGWGSNEVYSFTVTSANNVTLQGIWPSVKTLDGGISITANLTSISRNLNTTGGTNGGNIYIDGNLTIPTLLELYTDNTSGTDGNITVTGTINGAAGNYLNLFAGNGVIDLQGQIGNTTSPDTLQVANSGGTTFGSSVNVTTVTLTNTTGTIAFQGNLTATNLNTTNQGYNVALTGSSNTITNDVNFLNTGTVTIGDDAGDSSTFNGGLATAGNASNPSATYIAGTIQTSNDQIDLGATTMTANSTIISGNSATNIASITDGANSYSLDLQNGTATGTVTFTGNVTVNDLDTFSGSYAVVMQGSSNTIDTGTTFLNTGGVTLGNAAGDSFTFTGGLDTTAGATNIAGTVATTNTQMDLGAVTLDGNSTLSTGAGGGNLNTGTINADAAANNRTLAVTGGTGNVTLGAIGETESLQSLTVNSAGNLTLDAITTSGAVTQSAGSGTTTFGGTVTSGANVNITTNAIALNSNINAPGNTVTLTTTGNIDGSGIVTASTATLNASTAGLTTQPEMEVTTLNLTFTGSVGGWSGNLLSNPPPLTQGAVTVSAPGIVQVNGWFWNQPSTSSAATPDTSSYTSNYLSIISPFTKQLGVAEKAWANPDFFSAPRVRIEEEDKPILLEPPEEEEE